MSPPLHTLADAALAELGAVFAALSPDAADPLLDDLLAAHKIALYGVGREGLMMRALTMRLYHLGLDTHVALDMTTPPLGRGDLLVVSAGPGGFSTVEALMGVAKNAGARTLLLTAQPGGSAAALADTVVVLPAQTMADDVIADNRAAPGVLPMGSLYEAAQLVFFDLVTLLLRDRLGRSAEELRARHTNLE